MPSLTNQRKMKYLINKLYDLYQIQLDPSWKDLYEHSLQTTKPCYEILKDEQISDKDKTTAIINYLNTKCTGDNTVEKVNEFWYETFDFIQSHPDYITTHNARRIWEHMGDAAATLGVWNEDLGLIYSKLFDRVIQLQKEKQEAATQGISNNEEQQTKESQKIWDQIFAYIDSKKTLLPKRKTYWRFNKDGIYCETTDSKWYVAGSCGGAGTLQPDRDKKLCARVQSPILDEYLKYWADLEKGCFKYGLELEFALPSEKLNKFCEACQKEGLCDKNLISIGSDCTVHKPRELINDNRVWLGLEVTTQPLRYSKAKEVWTKLGRIAAENGGKFGNECGAGGHIHIDKPSDGYKQIQILNAFIKEGENLPKIFGRGEIQTDRYGNKIYMSGYSSTNLGLKEYTQSDSNGVWTEILNCVKYKQTLVVSNEKTQELREKGIIGERDSVGKTDYIIEPTSRGALNYINKHTIEIRGFSSRKDPEKNLENLVKVIAPVLGKEIVCDKQEGINEIQQTQPNINSKQDEFLLTLKQLNFSDDAIAYAKTLKFDEKLAATEMVSRAINCWNEYNRQETNSVQQDNERSR